MRRFALLSAALAALGASPAGAVGTLNDYPTEARVEYVFGCMAVNGQTPDALRRCSCSVDVIAEILPYDDYVAAETVLGMRLAAGERATLFRGTPAATHLAAPLRRAQAEAEIVCF
ncbi:hypothetical protein [Neomegalonema sp.]|uniref:hypothetical protein n=1 Tax=Neomegalonema sp. TaxID=2039713 RepID=UPI0026275D80|nr:hypothetical protein [Neomegalonema sp.]MDD2867296.1 hypothetical protein [Neomegalonema sp.]